MSSTLTSAPWAAATPSATRRTPSSTRSRVPSETVRRVRSRLAVSRLTLRVVPASILAMVRTAGSKTLSRRVTRVWKAWTISHATGIGSRQSCGAEACPPLPRTTTWIVSPDAIAGPGRVATTPAAWRCATCSANAPDGACAPSSNPSSSITREPVEGLEHRRLGAGQREPDLRVPVDAPAELDRVLEEGLRLAQDLGGFHRAGL